MQISTANLKFFFTAQETRFWQAYKAATTWYSQIATVYPVSTEQWVSGWIGMMQKARVWDGPRIVTTPAPQTYLVPIQPFELTWAIDKFKLEDDQFGIYNAEFEYQAIQLAKWPDYQLRDLIFDLGFWTGGYQNGVDGISNWNTAHPVNPYDASYGTYSNDFRGTFTVDGTVVGGGLTVNGFNSLWSTMSMFKADNGEALGIVPDLVVASPLLRAQGMTILNAQYIATTTIGGLGTGAVGTGNAPLVGATENPLKGAADILIVPDFLTNEETQNSWLLCQAKRGPFKPFSWLLRKAPVVTPRISPDDPAVFDAHQFIYGAEMRGAPAWSLPFLACISGP